MSYFIQVKPISTRHRSECSVVVVVVAVVAVVVVVCLFVCLFVC